MATPSKVELSPSDKPTFTVDSLSQDSAELTSKLLQENHDKHHIFFNKGGFHNHIVHHLLTVYALGASPEAIQRHYDNNKSYQRTDLNFEEKVVEDMHDPAKFKKYLGDQKYYYDFLVFFQYEMEAKGWQNVVNEYLFGGDERAEDLLVRLYAGFLHPLIHLGFGVEFQQPAIVAEALAQTAVHDSWIAPLFHDSERKAKEKTSGSKSLVELLADIQANEKIRSAPKWSDGNKIRDGILARAGDEMTDITSQYLVKPDDDLDEATAKLMNSVSYFTGCSQQPPHVPKLDFYYIHCLNCSVFLPSLLSQPWLSRQNYARLLTWKGRLDLAMYASRGSPKLLLDEVTQYTPKTLSQGSANDWSKIFEEINKVEDDGHSSKVIRALAKAREVSAKYESHDEFVLKGGDWERLANLAVDSVQEGENWVRSCGFEEAWREVPERSRL
ncbi:hypothetical protein M501DRAFT_544037 [Patellaria atrata CBS 101060]|uniref:HypA-like protein n=1 Tax=Patellaria atrata CBS 101060 TaxID=1346257 RepID=A0A9P4SEI7_9PEZI|nr:hypothetical protein M501DRAFT_544037 [Patellaria atrata CBS 101060]